MPIDRKKFFDAIRSKPFGGNLSSPAVSNIDAIIDEWERRNLTDLRWLAYMFATVLAECGRNMAPIDEIGKGRGHRYGVPVNGRVYYGRGYVQLTWDYNYRKMGELLGVDLLGNPELALRPDIASKILFEGMIRGSFTGKKLSDYFNATKADWVNARRIINGTDRANEIAGYGRQFYAALTGAKGGTTRTAVVVGEVVATVGTAGTVSQKPQAQGGGIDWVVAIPILIIGGSVALLTWRFWPRKEEGVSP